MAENKKGFVLYTDLIHTVSKLPDEVKGRLFQLILDYVNDKNPIPSDLLLEVSFEPIKQQLKRDLVKWENFRKKQSENGKRGGRPKNPSLLSESQKSLNVTVTDTVKVNVKDKEKEIYNSPAWIENICMTYKFKKQFVEYQLRDFVSTQKLKSGWESRTLDDLKDHFVSTIKKTKQTENQEQTIKIKW